MKSSGHTGASGDRGGGTDGRATAAEVHDEDAKDARRGVETRFDSAEAVVLEGLRFRDADTFAADGFQ